MLIWTFDLYTNPTVKAATSHKNMVNKTVKKIPSNVFFSKMHPKNPIKTKINNIEPASKIKIVGTKTWVDWYKSVILPDKWIMYDPKNIKAADDA